MSILLNKRGKIKGTKRGVTVQLLFPPRCTGTLLSLVRFVFVTLALPSDFVIIGANSAFTAKRDTALQCICDCVERGDVVSLVSVIYI